ncbi:phosphoheptose isomerase [Rhodohalobacter mucosus]|uniref:Phosphoheptose isomerase n=1 Tax=Rhodohalobacter mucosus TaxID=2079485 RepID=A0A316TPE4_9BACT|nr:phosphoheptose isomerase [Rhodohalobacter mucosus]PWN05678.1 phosphoheptose isomerase [Rhodohalobacter mucosus]
MDQKEDIFRKAEKLLAEKQLSIESSDRSRPWGGFYVVKEEQASRFIRTFFPSLKVADFQKFSKLSPKLLMVAPERRLSWQYHHRRSEIWRVIHGTVGVIVSDTDEQGPVRVLVEGDSISLNEGERHRLVGLDNWAVLAEIWQHTKPGEPSDEEDIVRLEDDFGR